MSLGIAFKGPEGVVLAADSRVTLQGQREGENVVILATYDNATKLLKVSGQDYVGAVTYGMGAIGQQQPRTAHSYIPEFEEELAREETGRLSVMGFAEKLSSFFTDRWEAEMPEDFQGPGMVFLVGGYDVGAPYGRVFEFEVPSRPVPTEPQGDDFGITWGGQREFTDRLIQGFDDSLPGILQERLDLTDEQRQEIRDHLRGKLTAAIPFAFLPLQDCVDIAIFLIRTTVSIQSWITGVRGVGGAIDVAMITRTEGFRPVQQKRIRGERPPMESRG